MTIESRLDALGRSESFAKSDGAGTGWREPDRSLLGADAVKPPELGERLPPRLMEWCQATAEELAVPVDYVAGSLLSFASAAIGNSRWAAPTTS